MERARKKLCLGDEAKCSMLPKYILPKPAINAHFVIYIARDCATDLTATCIDEVSQKGHTYQTVIFTTPWTSKSL